MATETAWITNCRSSDFIWHWTEMKLQKMAWKDPCMLHGWNKRF